MIEETIQQIEARLDAASNLSPETRAELTTLVAKLRAEAARLPSTSPDSDHANATTSPEAESMQDSVDQLRRSVEEFEGSHPRLVQLANHLANTLAGLGI
jgi:ABC-type transporter Mla subunit MlaD